MQIQIDKDRRDIKKITTLFAWFIFHAILEECIVYSAKESVTQPEGDIFIVFCRKGNYHHHIVIQEKKYAFV